MSIDGTLAQPDIVDVGQNSAGRSPTEGRLGDHIDRYIGALASLLIVSLAITLGLVFWSARTQDGIAIESSRHLASTALDIQSSQIGKILTDYTWWDEAYLNLAETFDPDWYDENFGDPDYLQESFGITATFAIGPDNRVLRHMHESEIAEGAQAMNIDAHIEGGFTKLIQEARHAVDGEFLATGGIVKMAGQLYLATVRVIHPHTEDLLATAAVTPANAYVAVMMRPLDDELLQTLAGEFGFVSLKHIPSLAGTGMLTLPLQSIDGENFGYLAWEINRPSKHVYAVILPALAAVILSIGLLGFYVLRLVQNNQTRLFHAMLQAKAADRAKVQFLSNVSHELRTPLNGVIGIAQILQREELKEDQKKLVGTLLNSANHQLDLIKDLLDVTRIESGNIKLACRPFDLCSLVRETVSLVDHDAKSKGLSVQVSLPENLPGQVIGDPVRVRQICLNLLHNAVKFTHSGGVEIALSSRSAGDFEEIELTVKDTGMGIEKEDQARIFTRFMQVDDSTARVAEGLGLGLPICQVLAKAMEGHISLESTPGEGTEFVVSFKLRRASTQAVASEDM